jgi:hypothetical protein
MLKVGSKKGYNCPPGIFRRKGKGEELDTFHISSVK